MGYVTRWRMHLAADALGDEGATVAELADRYGYRSEAAFARAFKRVVGVAPGAARSILREPVGLVAHQPRGLAASGRRPPASPALEALQAAAAQARVGDRRRRPAVVDRVDRRPGGDDLVDAVEDVGAEADRRRPGAGFRAAPSSAGR